MTSPVIETGLYLDLAHTCRRPYTVRPTIMFAPPRPLPFSSALSLSLSLFYASAVRYRAE